MTCNRKSNQPKPPTLPRQVGIVGAISLNLVKVLAKGGFGELHRHAHLYSIKRENKQAKKETRFLLWMSELTVDLQQETRFLRNRVSCGEL